MSSAASRSDTAPETNDVRRMLRDAVDDFAARATDTRRVRALRGAEPGFDRSLWNSLAGQGWLGILVPEQYGGQALGFGEMRVVTQGLAAALVPEPVTACAVLATSALLNGDNEALKRRLLPQMIAGDLIVALAWQEGITGTDHSCAGLHAIRTADGFTLNGSKRFVTPAAGADGFIVSARTGDQLGLYYLPADTPGVARKLELRADGTFSGLLTFNDAAVAADSIVATGPAAAAALARAIDQTTIMASVELHAVIAKALDITLDYMKTRVQFGRPIGSFQALQHRAVDLWIQKALCSAVIDDAVREMDQQPDAARLAELASRCKSRCSDAGLDVTRDCIRLHGAIGFTDDCDIGLHMKRALVLAAWLGNGAEHRR